MRSTNPFCFPTLFLALASPLTAAAQEFSEDAYKVFASNPPAGFLETLERLDRDNRFIFSQDEFFAISEADNWIVFFSPSVDQWTLPEFVLNVYEQTKEIADEVVRYSVEMEKDQVFKLTLVNLDKRPENSPNLKGCIAAIDLVSIHYREYELSGELIGTVCESYRRS